MEILIFLTIAAAGTAVAAYVQNLRGGFHARASGGDSGLAAIERALAISDLLSYAVLADGDVSDEESAALAEALRQADVAVTAADAVARLRALAAELKDETVLRDRITSTAMKLNATDRADVFRHVLELVRAGSGLGVGDTSYRTNRVVDSQRLVTLFAACLAIPTESVAAMQRGAPMGS